MKLLKGDIIVSRDTMGNSFAGILDATTKKGDYSVKGVKVNNPSRFVMGPEVRMKTEDGVQVFSIIDGDNKKVVQFLVDEKSKRKRPPEPYSLDVEKLRRNHYGNPRPYRKLPEFIKEYIVDLVNKKFSHHD